VTLLNTEILTDGKCHCNIRITGILVTCWEAAGCYAGVAVALHARCKQSFVVLGVRRGDGLLGSPGGRGTRWGGPDPSRSSDKLCSCFPALALHTSCRASSTSTVPFCQASLLWLFFFLNQSLCYLSLPLLMHFCFPLSGSSVTLPPAGWWPVSITQNCALSPMSLCLEFAVPVLTQCLPTVNLFARKANQAEPKGDAPPCKSQLSCTSAACRSSCFCVNPKAQALEFLLYCWLGVEKDLEVTR